MTEHLATATRLDPVVGGVSHWHVADDRIGGFISSAHAVTSGPDAVLIDPLPLDPALRDTLGTVRWIVLTSGSHQRAAWQLRRELGAAVHAPALSSTLEEEPDGRYGDADVLPGGLCAVFTPGAGTTQHTLLLEGDRRVAFVPDLLARPAGADLVLVPDEYMHDPGQARESVEKLRALGPDVLCLAHGVPVVSGVDAMIGRALDT